MTMILDPTQGASPAATQGQPVIAGAKAPGPAEIYAGLRAQRHELSSQLEALEEKRDDLAGQLKDPEVTGANKTGIEQRIALVDQRIAAVEKQITDADAKVANAAAIPGAVPMTETGMEMPMPERNEVPEQAWVLGGLFIVFVLCPMAIAFARRIWRRGATALTSIPKELGAQLLRLEQAIESIAIEVERISEGQRFVSKVVAEGGQRALGEGAAEPISVKAREALRDKRG
jgi:hypothetical protein